MLVGPIRAPYTYNSSLVEDLLMGQRDTICLYARLESLSIDQIDSESYVNRSEISQALDTFGVDQSMNDADFPLNGIEGDNVGGAPESNADDELDGDGTATTVNGNPVTDQDSEDPALVQVFDLALTKRIDPSTPGPYQYEDTIKYLITVYNQGSVVADSIEIVDTIPPGLRLVNSSLNFIWNGPSDKPTTTISSPISPGDSQTVCIYLILQANMGSDFVNVAEISAAQDDMGNDREDRDSP